uniref:Uncharacterized protein n=1 Tax=Phlebotomus papatasi TaxID=29031 RepID=A0A1B0DK52_PHLPP
MQHASFLYRQRAPRGLRATHTPTVSRCKIPSTQIAGNTTSAHSLLSSRSQESRSRSLRTNMPSFCQAGYAGYRTL